MQINGYLYDTHVHTSEGSACGQNTGAEMAGAYQKAGYAGIVVTDHFFYGNTAADRSLPWKDWVEQFCKGYENMQKKKAIRLDCRYSLDGSQDIREQNF